MHLILTYLKRYKKLFALNVASVFGFALVELGIPTIVAQMVDQGVAKQDEAYLYQMGAVIALISVIGVAGTVLLGYCCAKISTSITCFLADYANQQRCLPNPDVCQCPVADCIDDSGYGDFKHDHDNSRLAATSAHHWCDNPFYYSRCLFGGSFL